VIARKAYRQCPRIVSADAATAMNDVARTEDPETGWETRVFQTDVSSLVSPSVPRDGRRSSFRRAECRQNRRKTDPCAHLRRRMWPPQTVPTPSHRGSVRAMCRLSCADRDPCTVRYVSHISTKSHRLMDFIQRQVKPPARALSSPGSCPKDCWNGLPTRDCAAVLGRVPGASLRSAPSGAFGDLDATCARQQSALVVGRPEDLEERQVRNIPTRLVVRRHCGLCGFRTLPALHTDCDAARAEPRTCARKLLRDTPLH